MFKNRRSSQRPSDELINGFKGRLSQLNPGVVASTAPAQDSTSLTEALDISGLQRPMNTASQDMKDADPTPRGSNEAWNFPTSGFTPSLMDPSSHAFNMFANQMPGYYTPTPGGTNTIYHPQAGDLHTPGYGISLGTPLSLPTSEGTLHAGHPAAAFHGFQPHMPPQMQQQHFQNVNPFHIQQPHIQQQPGFPPHQFSHQPLYEHPEVPMEGSPIDDMNLDANLHQEHSPQMLFHSHTLQRSMQPPRPVHPSGDSFRYHVTLNAPTAMIKRADEIPITYLNKGQAYTLNVVDTRAKQQPSTLQYRTFVRVSFEDEQQRQKPAACWQLWKEGRGTNEAHQRGGRLQAVEYVDPGQIGSLEDPSKPRVQLESASFDGFCVTWSPQMGSSECPIAVRFNFLSTDFSHSKGVKGIPVRLCAKTEVIGEVSGFSQTSSAEVCYCKVKLFRDHGAERKLSNDIAHVKKTIEKLNTQIMQIESGMRDMGKRKRAGSIARAPTFEGRAGKVPKHRRTWSMSSVTSNSGRGSAEDDLHSKLATLQDMFTSTRPASVLYLRGDPEDDPDAFPVKLSGEMTIKRNESTDTTYSERRSSASQTGGLSSISPTPSTKSIENRRDSTLLHQATQQPTPFASISRGDSGEWQAQQQTATADLQSTPSLPQQLASPPENQPIKVQTRSPKTGAMSSYVEALGVDQNYKPPPEPAIKPVACFYIKPRIAGEVPSDSFHRAIYLYRRTLKDFVNAVAMKCGIEPTQVGRTVRFGHSGIRILFDDECIQQLPEGQDMTAEFRLMTPAASSSKPGREWDAGATDVQCDGDLPTVNNVPCTPYELTLLF